MKRILVVDDAATIRLYHRQILEAARYAVDEAFNGVEALEKALVAPYDLFLIDVNMPKLDGFGLLRALNEAGLGDVPALVITTAGDARAIAEADNAGACQLLMKPIRPDDLLRHVGGLIGKAAS